MPQASHTTEVAIAVPHEPLRASSASFRSWALYFPSPDVAQFRPTFWSLLLWLVFCMPGPAILLGAPHPHEGFKAAVTMSIASLFTVMGVVGLLATCGRRIVIADRLRGRMVIRHGLPGIWGQERIVWLQDIGALQMCSYYVTVDSDSSSYRTYELNVVLTDPPGERVNVTSHASYRSLHEDAESLAAFFSVPLLDHISG